MLYSTGYPWQPRRGCTVESRVRLQLGARLLSVTRSQRDVVSTQVGHRSAESEFPTRQDWEVIPGSHVKLQAQNQSRIRCQLWESVRCNKLSHESRCGHERTQVQTGHPTARGAYPCLANNEVSALLSRYTETRGYERIPLAKWLWP